MNSCVNRNSSSDSDSIKSGKHLKQQVKMVAGELENVLGELKTVVGDLRHLVTQIDEVTSKIDKEYGLDEKTLDKAKRRLSTSVLETRPSRKERYRLTVSQSFDLTPPGYQRDCVSAAEIRDLVPAGSVSSRSSSSAYRRRMQRLLHPQSGYTSTDSDDNGICNEKRTDFSEKSAEELRHTKVKRVARTRDENHKRVSKSSNHSSCENSSKQFDYIPRAQELTAMRMTKCNYANEKPKLPVPNGIAKTKPKKHKQRDRSSKCSPVEYSGVYEKELDSLLECDEMQHCDSFDEASCSDADNGNAYTSCSDSDNRNAYTARYDRDVNTWTTYTMVNIDTQGYSDEQLSETTETTSDILNDNHKTNKFNPYGINFTDNSSIFSLS